MQTFLASARGSFRFLASRAFLLFAACCALAAVPAHATLLEYWGFNNVSSAFSSPSTLGSFSTTTSTGQNNGELFNSSTLKLSSNTASGAVFTNGSLDLSGVIATRVNFGTTGAAGSWGAYTDSGLNKPTSDTASGVGSLMIIGNANDADNLVFTLSSTSYSSLVLTSEQRVSSSNTPTLSWSYSLDGSSWTSLTATGTLTGGSFSLSTLTLPSAVNNLSTFYVKETVTFPGTSGGSFAIDNLQLNGTALAVPEPSTWVLLIVGGGLAVGFALRRPAPAKARC